MRLLTIAAHIKKLLKSVTVFMVLSACLLLLCSKRQPSNDVTQSPTSRSKFVKDSSEAHDFISLISIKDTNARSITANLQIDTVGRHSSSTSATLIESYTHLSTNAIVRFEKYEVLIDTLRYDSLVLYTKDTSGFIYDKTDSRWGHIDSRPQITLDSGIFRLAFPIEKPVHTPRIDGYEEFCTHRPFWISQRLSDRVKLIRKDEWLYSDTLKPLFQNVNIKSDQNDQPLLCLKIVDTDSFSVFDDRPPSDGTNNYPAIIGSNGFAFEVKFGYNLVDNPDCKSISSYLSWASLVGSRKDPPRDHFSNISRLSDAKKEQLVHSLVCWGVNFKIYGRNDLYDELGEREDTVPDNDELKRRIMEMYGFYNDLFAIIGSHTNSRTFRMLPNFIQDRYEPECSRESFKRTEISKDNYIIYCEGDTSILLYPTNFLLISLRHMGSQAKELLAEFGPD